MFGLRRGFVFPGAEATATAEGNDDSSAALRNDNKEDGWARARATAEGNGKDDSSAALRNDNKDDGDKGPVMAMKGQYLKG